MKKVLLVCGSPRKNGNTEILLGLLSDHLASDNVTVEIVKLYNNKIEHCSHCDGCIALKRCVKKDSLNEIYNKMINSDVIIIASPVYVGMPTSLLMALLQRVTYIDFNNGRKLNRKIGAPIAVAGETGQLATINCLADFYMVNGMRVVGSSYWNVGVASKKGSILKDHNGIKYMENLANELLYEMNKE